jgi:hypothetical protein
MAEQQWHDTAAEAEELQRRLVGEGHAAWAARLSDTIAAGSTGTEIVMGLRWQLGKLFQDRTIQLSPETRKLVAELTRHLNEALRWQ